MYSTPLDERSIARTIPPAESGEAEFVVVIDSENRDDVLRDFSLVIGRYGESDGPSGTLAVIGPTRLPYARAIGNVRRCKRS